jgi:hypothetical protein
MLEIEGRDHAVGPQRGSESAEPRDDSIPINPGADRARGLAATLAVGRVASRDSARDPLCAICQQLIDALLIALFSLGQGLNAPFGGLKWGIEPGARTLTSVILE